jgi:hypothetical protein
VQCTALHCAVKKFGSILRNSGTDLITVRRLPYHSPLTQGP